MILAVDTGSLAEGEDDGGNHRAGRSRAGPGAGTRAGRAGHRRHDLRRLRRPGAGQAEQGDRRHRLRQPFDRTGLRHPPRPPCPWTPSSAWSRPPATPPSCARPAEPDAGAGGSDGDRRGRRGPAAAPPADPGAGVLRPAHRPVDDAVDLPVDPVPRLAVAAGRAGRAGRHLGGVAVPRGRAAAGAAPVLVDGHAGLAGHPGRLRLVGLRDVRAGPRQERAQRAREPAAGGSGGGIYLEVAASVTTFLLAGRLYEARARRTAGRAMRELAAAGARDVCVLDDDDTERRIPATQLRSRAAVRGPAGGADRRRRRGPGRPVRGRPQHDDRRVGPGRRRPRRRGDRRHHRADRPPGRPGRHGRRRHPARPHAQAGRAGPGGQGRHPAAGRPDLRGVRPGRAGLLGPDAGRLAAGGQRRRATRSAPRWPC